MAQISIRGAEVEDLHLVTQACREHIRLYSDRPSGPRNLVAYTWPRVAVAVWWTDSRNLSISVTYQ